MWSKYGSQTPYKFDPLTILTPKIDDPPQILTHQICVPPEFVTPKNVDPDIDFFVGGSPDFFSHPKSYFFCE